MAQKQESSIQPSAFQPLSATEPETGRRFNPRRALLIGAAALFALAMLFLLGARSVELKVVAESEADVSISGLVLPFGQRYLMRPGTYQVEVLAQGYHPLLTDLEVNDQDSQQVELVLQPLPGLLSIDSDPAGAQVVIDGEVVGKTPLREWSIEAGEHQLQVLAARYLPLEQELAIPGRSIHQQLELKLSPAWAEVTVNSEPAGATVLVDGEATGTTPATVEILQGEHQLILQLAAYADWQQDLVIEAGQAQDLGTASLLPATAMLELSSSPSGANVTIDGEFRGQTPLSLQISPDREHRLAVFKPGYRRYNSTLQLPAAGSDNRQIKLQPRLGEVRFEISPAQAQLRVDGKVYGRGSRTLSLPAFEHNVEISLDGHATVRRRVTPRQGLEQLVQVSLQTEQEARLARLKPELTTSLGQTLLLFDPVAEGGNTFTMGASRREPGRRANEVLHPVSLNRMFYLQTTETTNAQFRLYEKNHDSGHVQGNSLNREHQPAVQVSWQQAASFANWLSKREGLPPFYLERQGIITGFNPDATGYRLPSEAEWAWAARVNGATGLKFPWEGNKFPPTQPVENYADASSAFVTGRVLSDYKDGNVVSATVASYGPNHHGLYDLGGNVAEWVHDVYSIPAASGVTAMDPLGAQAGDNYVIRGASWDLSKISQLRLSYRDYGQAGRDDVGFRLARYAE